MLIKEFRPARGTGYELFQIYRCWLCGGGFTVGHLVLLDASDKPARCNFCGQFICPECIVPHYNQTHQFNVMEQANVDEAGHINPYFINQAPTETTVAFLPRT